jgi:protein involved in polysaccharide export with SLBB domain
MLANHLSLPEIFKIPMKKFSSPGLILLVLLTFQQVKSQVTTTSPTTTAPTTTSPTIPQPMPATVGGIPPVTGISEGTLQSLGFDQTEIDAIMNASGVSTTGTTTTATDAASQTQPAQQQATGQPTTTTTIAPPDTTTTPITPQQTTDTGGVSAPVFGQDFFRTASLNVFDRVPDGKVDDNYILGEGDQLTVSIYGYAYYNQTFTINPDGYISTQEVGRIYLSGLTFGAARQLLRQRFASAFDLANSSFDVTLVYSKSIQVNIVGEVFSPGSYNLASVNTAFNALVASGGVTDIGSVRNIQIKRNNRVIQQLDIYQFLMNPGSTDDTYLENNDYIIVPSLGRVVQIEGEVNRPHKYELISGENLNELVYYAGGLKSTAYKRNVTIYRYTANENIVLDVNLDSVEKNQTNFELLDGDRVVFTRIPELIENIVTVEGAIRFPVTYELTGEMRISDLISKAKGTTYEAYTDRAYLIRKNEKLNEVYIPFDLNEVMQNPSSPFNFKLTKFDIVEVFSKEQFRETFNVSISGAVKVPGTFPYYENMTLKDLLYYSGGLRVEAANNNVEVSRIVNILEATKESTATRVIIETLSVDKNLELPDQAESFILQPYDQVFVRTTPEFELQRNITLQGEVKYPGDYTLQSKTETVADVIERAGGVTQYAYVEGSTIARPNIASTLLFLDKALKDPKSKYNYVLRAGDIITVPRQGDLVLLRGAIEFPFVGKAGDVVVPFDKGRTARYYVKHYGKNFSDDADRGGTYIIDPNGYVRRTHNFLWFIHFYPRVKIKGSQVVVPVEEEEVEDPQPPPPPAEPFDWNTFMATLSAGILSFATIYVLIDRSR